MNFLMKLYRNACFTHFFATSKTYILIVDEDDGSRQWQSVIHQNIPTSLAKHIKGVDSRGWRICDLDIAPKGRWYLRGESLKSEDDTSSRHYSWWSKNVPNETQKQLVRRVKTKGLRLCFGSHDRCLLLMTDKGNSYCDASSNRRRVHQTLIRRILERHKDKGEVFLVRLFSFDRHSKSGDSANEDSGRQQNGTQGAYFIHDNEGSQWNFSGYSNIKDHVKNCKDTICDVAIAGDGNWIVVHPTRFVVSKGIPEKLQSRLRKFYSEQRHRRELRKVVINEYRKIDEDIEEESIDQGTDESVKSCTSSPINVSESNDTVNSYDHITSSIGDLIEDECERLKDDESTKEALEVIELSDTKETFPIGSILNSCPDTSNSNIASLLHLENLVDGFLDIRLQSSLSVNNELDHLSAKLDEITKKERLKRIEVTPDANRCFIWRGLRADESGRGLFARDPSSKASLEDAVIYNGHSSQYVHLTYNPAVAIYYASAFNEEPSSRCRIAQIDISRISRSHIVDLSSEDKCNMLESERAIHIATENQLVFIYEYIPVSAIISIIDLPDSIPRGVRGTLKMFLEGLDFNLAIDNLVYEWIRFGIKKLLQEEISCAEPSEMERPPHIASLAMHIGILTHSNALKQVDSPVQALWRKIGSDTELLDSKI